MKGDYDALDPIVWRRFWAAMMLARHVDTFHSILAGRPVMVRNLSRVALKRAYRGQPVPAGDWVEVTPEMLDAVNEGGPFKSRAKL